MDIKDAVIGAGLVIGILVLFAVILTFPVYWLWNWLMPIIFGLKEITLWQSLGLNLLCNILFKSTPSSNK